MALARSPPVGAVDGVGCAGVGVAGCGTVGETDREVELSSFDVDAAAARHWPVPGISAQEVCVRCSTAWPCDAAQTLDAVRERDEMIRVLLSEARPFEEIRREAVERGLISGDVK